MPPPATPPTDTPRLPDGPAPQVLDTAAAIALMDDSQELYQEIAQSYLQEISDLAERLDGLLGQAPLGEATRTLHTFKGLSLTVGANLLSEVFKRCELQLKELQQQGQALDPGRAASMKDALEGAIAQTRAALLGVLAQWGAVGAVDPADGSAPAATVAGSDPSALTADLRALRSLLVSADMQALDQSALLPHRHPPHQAALQALHQSVKVFDFSQAVVQCDELIKTFSTITR